MMTRETIAATPPADAWSREIAAGTRFGFGKNWARFLALLDDDRLRSAERSLATMLDSPSLVGKTLLDIGSGSGLFSLAARRLGAKVYSFDFDSDSVACTAELKRRYFPNDADWTVEQGSVLDRDFLNSIPRFDVVYSWGVLHHTGEMWQALDNAAGLVADRGRLFIAIYNDQGRGSRRWSAVKRAYVSAPGALKWAVVAPALVRLWGPTVLRDALRGKPLAHWKSYRRNSLRGMDPWRDVIDWVGGYPFEVASPEAIFKFFAARRFRLTNMTTVAGGLGCNEFVFVRD